MVSKKTLWPILAGLLCAPAFAAEIPFPQSFIESELVALRPALCRIDYSFEVTDPSSGNTSKNSSTAVGILLSKDGLIIARGHVALDNTEPFNIRVTVGQGEQEKEYDAKVLEKPDDVNIVFFRIETTETVSFPIVHFSPGAEPKLGEPVLVFGLMGRTLDYERGFFIRYVNSVLDKPRRTYCLDEPMPLGFVGGPVINAKGQIVGVTGYDLASNEGGDIYVRSGQPLVYQSDLFAKYVSSPPTTKDAVAKPEGWLGVFTQPLSDEFAEYWSLPKKGGVVVSTIMPGSPAEKSGVQKGDVIVSFNGTDVQAKQSREVVGFTKLVRDAPIGQPITVKLLRNAQPVDVAITLIERPKAAKDADEFEDSAFGLTVREITTDLRIRANLAADVQGVVVFKVRSGSPASLADIRPGVIILNFGNYPVNTIAEFKDAAAKVAAERPAEIPVFCRVGQVTAFFRIQPRWETAAPKS